MGYSPWGRKESDTTEQLTHTHEGHPEPYLLAALGVRGEAQPSSIQGLPLFPLNYNATTKGPYTELALSDPGNRFGLSRLHFPEKAMAPHSSTLA